MYELTDKLGDTLKAHRIPYDVLASVDKMVLSSDISDMRQKEKRERIKMETAMLARSTGNVFYNAAEVSL